MYIPFVELVTGLTVAVLEGFAAEIGFAVVDGLDDELVVFDDDAAGFVLLFATGFLVLDELLVWLPLFVVVVFPFEATVPLLPFCLGVRACILASSAEVI